MEIKTSEYRVWVEGATVFFEGTMRLSSNDAYAPIQEIMAQVLATAPTAVTLDLTGLEFLNSSGINLFAKFTIEEVVSGAGFGHFLKSGTMRHPLGVLSNFRRLRFATAQKQNAIARTIRSLDFEYAHMTTANDDVTKLEIEKAVHHRDINYGFASKLAGLALDAANAARNPGHSDAIRLHA